MGVKEWWKKLSYLKKGILIGALFGFIIYIFTFNNYSQDTLFNQVIGNLGYFTFCKILKADIGEDCGWGFIVNGWLLLPIVYAIIGIIIGLFIKKIKKN